MFLNRHQPHHTDTRLRYNLYSEKGLSVSASDREKIEAACNRALGEGTRGMFQFASDDTLVRVDVGNPT